MTAPSPAASPLIPSLLPRPPYPAAAQAIFQSVVVVALSVVTVACCRGLLPASMSAVAYTITSFAILLVTTFIVSTMLLPKVRRCARPQANTMSKTCNTTMTRSGSITSGSITQVLPAQNKVEEHYSEQEILDKVGTEVLSWYMRSRKHAQVAPREKRTTTKSAREAEVDRLEEQNERNRTYRAALLEQIDGMNTLVATYRAALLEAAGQDAVENIEKTAADASCKAKAAAPAKEQGIGRGGADQEHGVTGEKQLGCVMDLTIETPRKTPRPRRVSTTDMRATSTAHELISEAEETERCAVGMTPRTLDSAPSLPGRPL